MDSVPNARTGARPRPMPAMYMGDVEQWMLAAYLFEFGADPDFCACLTTLRHDHAATIAAVILSAGYLLFLPAPTRIDLGLGIMFGGGIIVGWKARGEMGR